MDITFVEPNDPRLADVNETNCYNSSDLGFADIFTITTVQPNNTLTSGAASGLAHLGRYAGWVPVALGGLLLLL